MDNTLTDLAAEAKAHMDSAYAICEDLAYRIYADDGKVHFCQTCVDAFDPKQAVQFMMRDACKGEM